MKSYLALSVAALAASLVVGCSDKKPTPQASANPELTKVQPAPLQYPEHASTGAGAPVSTTGTPTAEDTHLSPPPPIDTKTASADLPTPGAKYTVRKNDTLWNIAQRAYGNGKQYKKIVAANPSIKGDRVALGQTITIPN